MRIVGGEFRGRPLAAPRTEAIRPTTDRTREAVFNVLAHRFADKLDGARVLDLFAGTGALGLEALSRGAAHCLFIEESAEGRGLIRTNVEAFGLTGRTKIFRRDATDLGEAGTLRRSAWSSPIRPMARGSARRRCDRRAPAAGCCPARCAWSRKRPSPPFAPGAGLRSLDERGYGETIIRFIEAGLSSARAGFGLLPVNMTNN